MSFDLDRVPLLRTVRDVLSRHRRTFVLALAVPLAGTLAAALFMPRSYRSSALVVVERGAGVSDDDVDGRLSMLTSENLRRSRLDALITRWKLDHDGRGAREPLIDELQKVVTIELDKEDRAGRNVVVAVHVSFTANSPQLAAIGANEFAAFYQREDLRMREARAHDTLAKLQEQLADARGHLDEQEARLKDYKMRNLNELPEQVGLHLSELAQLNSQMRGGHADSDRSTLAGVTRRPADAAPYDTRLDRLAELRSRYTDEYPEVRALKREIELHPLAGKAADAARDLGVDMPPDPMAAELAASRLASARQRNADLAQKAAVHEQGILNAPFRQQELEALLPEYIAARNQYQTVWEKYEAARMWDPHHDDGRIVVLDAAVPRPKAIAPSMTRILAVGFAVALATAAAAVLLMERLDSTFHSADQLRVFTRVPVLATVPRLASSNERRRRTRSARLFAAKLLVLLAVTFAGSAYLSHGTPAVVALIHRIQP